MKYISLLLLLSLMAPASFGNSVVSGTAAYRERIAMPPEAVFEATLEDISRADAAAEILGSVKIEQPGNPPIRFEIPYDPARVQDGHRYSVRAKILVGGKLLFTTDRIAPVLAGGHGDKVSLVLRKVGGRSPAAKTRSAKPLGELPASFAGQLPCADCPGIRYRVDLFPDQVFFRLMEYLDRNAGFDDIGTWAISPDGATLLLSAGRDTPARFAIKDTATLALLGADGNEIPSNITHELKRASGFGPLEPKLVMRGSYQYLADAGLFTECSTRRRMPVAQEQDNAALEAAYVKARRHAGEEIPAHIEGRIALRPKVDGDGLQPTVIVERFIELAPGETCGSQHGTADLVNTLWRLTRLGDQPVIPVDNQRAASLVLRSEGNKLTGSDGCNRLMGGYQIDGESLSFGKVASTRMACPPPAMETARAFTRALEQTKAYTITGEHLELLGADGMRLARFEALYLR